MMLAALEPHFWAAFCRAVGCADLLEQQLAPALPGEPAFEELSDLFRTCTREEWADVLTGVDACCEPIYSIAEALDSRPVGVLGMISGEGLQPPVQLSAKPIVSRGLAPSPGEHNADLLSELRYGI